MRLDLQLFGGRGASSSRVDGVRALSNKAKDIMREWSNTKQATEESEEAMKRELNKMSFNDLLKLAQRTDEADLSSLDTGGAFAVNMLHDNIYEVGRKKNSNKWGIEFGRWREEKRGR